MESTEMIKQLLLTFFPEEIVNHFEVSDIRRTSVYIEIHFRELPELVPDTLSALDDVILDGFCNPLELQSFPLNGMPVYLKLHRRRWKSKGSGKHHSNSYDLNPEGVKATKEFASFLKGAFG